MQEAHDSFVFARYIFMMVIIATIIILSGVIITIGPMNISVADAYYAIIDRFYPGPYLLIGNAFVFAFLCSSFIIGLAAIKGATSETLILAGIAVNYFFSAMSQLFNYFADDEQLRLMSSWGMGSLSAFSWNKIPLIFGVFAVCIPLLMLKAWDLNIMTAGDETAKSIGVDANRVRIIHNVGVEHGGGDDRLLQRDDRVHRALWRLTWPG
jgi:ABC-type Fe3+-siderophore transport system permease subunit